MHCSPVSTCPSELNSQTHTTVTRTVTNTCIYLCTIHSDTPGPETLDGFETSVWICCYYIFRIYTKCYNLVRSVCVYCTERQDIMDSLSWKPMFDHHNLNLILSWIQKPKSSLSYGPLKNCGSTKVKVKRLPSKIEVPEHTVNLYEQTSVQLCCVDKQFLSSREISLK